MIHVFGSLNMQAFLLHSDLPKDMRQASTKTCLRARYLDLGGGDWYLDRGF